MIGPALLLFDDILDAKEAGHVALPSIITLQIFLVFHEFLKSRK